MSAQAVHVLKAVHCPGDNQFMAEVFAGLRSRPRTIPPRRFYDRRGSELFEAITATSPGPSTTFCSNTQTTLLVSPGVAGH
jgi:uncharacterized SAM-dependent methyltransferase